MYNFTFGQNGHYSKKKIKSTMRLSSPMPLIKVEILLVNAETLVKLNLLKNQDFLECVVKFNGLDSTIT
jgi:hypothetical protein